MLSRSIQIDRDHPTVSITKDCWQNTYATYQIGQRSFLHESKEGHRRHQRCRRTTRSTRNSTVDPAAVVKVITRTPEVDLPTDGRSDNVTLAEGPGKWRDWRILPSTPTRCQLQDQVTHTITTEGHNDHPPTPRALAERTQVHRRSEYETTPIAPSAEHLRQRTTSC